MVVLRTGFELPGQVSRGSAGGRGVEMVCVVGDIFGLVDDAESLDTGACSLCQKMPSERSFGRFTFVASRKVLAVEGLVGSAQAEREALRLLSVLRKTRRGHGQESCGGKYGGLHFDD